MSLSPEQWRELTLLFAGLSTLAVFSFLIKENPFYRFFEHIYIGIATGLGVILTFKNFLWPNIIVPLLGFDIVQFPDGTFSKEYNPWVLMYGVAMCFGMFFYFSYSRRHAWLSKLVIGFSLGIGGGLAFKAFFSEWIPQIQSSFKPLLVRQCAEGACAINWWESFENAVFVATFAVVMYYFFFSFRRTTKAGAVMARSGRLLLMVCFGAFFGSTVMARMALLVERVSFLLIDWRMVVAQILGISSGGGVS